MKQTHSTVSGSPRRLQTTVLLSLALVVIAVAPAHANAGIPMLATMWPVSWLLILPIIAIEAAIARRVCGIDRRLAWKVSGAANLASTFVGIPATWGVLVLVQMFVFSRTLGLNTLGMRIYAVTAQSSWLTPYDGELKWMHPAAAAFLCIPFYFMSVWVEARMARKQLLAEQAGLARRWAWIANSVTYGVIFPLLTFVAVHAYLSVHP